MKFVAIALFALLFTWENLFTAKVAKYINVTLAIDLVYDRDTIAKWQFREVLSAGFSYDIF